MPSQKNSRVSLGTNVVSEMTPADRLNDLQRRYQLLEGETRACYETAQLNLRQNKDTIKQLKEEGKILSQQLGQLREGGTISMDEQVSQRLTDIESIKRNRDSIRYSTSQKTLQLSASQATIQELRQQGTFPTISSSSDLRQIRVLENRIDKATLKFEESLAVKRTYEQIIEKLAAESVSFDAQITEIDQALKQKKEDLEELVLLSHDAYHAKELGQAELHSFEQGVMEERMQRDRDVQEKRLLVSMKVAQRSEVKDRLAKYERDADMSVNQQMSSPKPVILPEYSEKRKKLREQLENYQKALRVIQNATGFSEPNEIILKYLTQKEELKNLRRLKQKRHKKIQDLQIEKEEVLKAYETTKYLEAGNAGRRQIVDDIAAQRKEAFARCENNRDKFENIHKITVSLNGGREQLMSKLQVIGSPGETLASTYTYRSAEDDFLSIKSRLCLLKQSLKEANIVFDSVDFLDSYQTRIIAEETDFHEKLAKIPIRAKFQDTLEEVDEDEDEDMEDDVSEDVPSRDDVKKVSEQVVERETRKKKREEEAEKNKLN